MHRIWERRMCAAAVVMIAAVSAIAGCDRKPSSGSPKGEHAGHDHAAGEAHPHADESPAPSAARHDDAHASHDAHFKPPHGGVLVELGEDVAHVEVVVDRTAGTFTLYFLDCDQRAVRLSQPAVQVELRIGDSEETRPLPLEPVASTLTGETRGDTSQFSAAADWLRTGERIAGVIEAVTIRGQTMDGVPFLLDGEQR